MTKKYFHLTIGPVQGFIASARRTRDLWAGSFILSTLSAVAMRSAIAQESTTIIFPAADKGSLQWLEPSNTQPERFPNYPNRFMAEVPADFNPQAVVTDINAAWQSIANAVWTADFQNANAETKAIWDRQVAHYWEISWVLTDDRKDTSALDRRKNWRSHIPPAEPGNKCMLMDSLQELSGSLQASTIERQTFWKKQAQVSKRLDISAKEHLSAIAYIKRRLIIALKEGIQAELTGWQLNLKINPSDANEDDIRSQAPSTAHIAAVDWLKAIKNKMQDDQTAEEKIKTNIRRLIESIEGIPQTNHLLKSESNSTLIKDNRKNSNFNNLSYCEASLFYPHLINSRLDLELTPDNERKLLDNLNALCERVDKKPTAFYAILCMDGDSFGQFLSNSQNHAKISKGLNAFTKEVPKIVKQHTGFTLYAGGEDVLAMLPISQAIACAHKLQQEFTAIFQSKLNKGGENVLPTISAGIVFSHLKMPLMQSISRAHEVLDDIAKEQTGRNAIACEINKPSGRTAQWAMPWDKAADDDDNSAMMISTISETLKEKNQADASFSTKFLYHFRNSYHLFKDKNSHEAISKDLLTALVISNLQQSKGRAAELSAAEQKLAKQIIDQSWIYKSDSKGQPIQSDQISDAFVMLARFLATDGIDGGNRT